MPNKNNKKQYLIIAIAILSVITIGFTLAYFQGQIGSGATANVTVTTKTTDVLTFNKGNDIAITATQANFGQGAGNRSGSTTATATLLANNDTNSATQTYNVYLYIQSNDFIYTTYPTANTPELMLTITNPNNQAVTSLTDLTYTTSGGVSGFDITAKSGLIQIASNYTITSTGTKTDTWNVTVTLINLNSDQQLNTGKTFSARVIIQKEEIVSYYWNDDFDSYIYSYPLGQKITYEDYNNNPTNWTSGSPTTYATRQLLASNSEYYSNFPIYIKTDLEHQACLYYNNHEFCLGANYWVGTIGVNDEEAGWNTVAKLQVAMESALQLPLNTLDCSYGYCGIVGSHIGYCASCGNNNLGCFATSYGEVECRAYYGYGSMCGVLSDGSAYCGTD